MPNTAPITTRARTDAQAAAEKAAFETAIDCWSDEDPAGHCDNGGRWWPSDTEGAACCDSKRTPSRTWPWTLRDHCRSDIHRATRNQTDPTLVRACKRLLAVHEDRSGLVDVAGLRELISALGVPLMKRLTAAEYTVDDLLDRVPTRREVLDREVSLRVMRALAA